MIKNIKKLSKFHQKTLLIMCKSFQFVFKLHELKGLQSYKQYVEIILSEMCNVGTEN